MLNCKKDRKIRPWSKLFEWWNVIWNARLLELPFPIMLELLMKFTLIITKQLVINECKTVALHLKYKLFSNLILMCIIWPGSANVDLAYYCVLIKKFLRKWIYRLVGHPVQTCAVFTPKHGSECYTFFNLIMRFCNRYTQADLGKIINKTTINYGHNII